MKGENSEAPDAGLPRASISIGCSEPALEAIANSGWAKLPISVANGDNDDQLLFDVSVNSDNPDVNNEKLQRQIAWSWENKKSARVRYMVRKAREEMKRDEKSLL